MRALIGGAGLLGAIGVTAGAHDSYFTTDDHVFFAQDREMPFGLRYLTEPIYDHLSPWHRLQDHVVFSLTHQGWWLALAISLLWYVACLALFTAVVRELVGSHPAGVAACLVFAASPLFLRAAQWWALAAQTLPQLCFTLLAVWAGLRWAAQRRRRWLALALAAYALALLAFIKALLIPLFLVLVLYLLPARLRPVRELARTAWRRDRALWLGVGLLTAVYVAVVSDDRYYSTIPDAPGASPTLWAHFLVTAWLKGAVPLAFDGTVPRHLGPGNWAVALVAQGALLALVAASVLRRRGLAVAWAGAVAIFLAAMAASGSARLGQFGSHFIALDPRYTFEAALALLLVATVALATVAPRLPAVAVAAVAAVCAGFAVDAFLRLERTFDGSRHRAYFERVDRSLAAARSADPRVSLVEAPTPDYIVPASITGANLLSRVLPLHDPDIRVGLPTGHPALVDRDGRVTPVRLRPEGSAPGACAGTGGAAELTVRAASAAGGLHVLTLIVAPQPRRVEATVVADSGVPGGEHIGGYAISRFQASRLRMPGGASGWRMLVGLGRLRSVTLRPDPGERVCVRRAAIGGTALPG